MKKTFYSNGKLLITGEYLVLDGAEALAIPTKFGQSLTIENNQIENQIHWQSYDSDNSIWFEDSITFQSIQNKECSTENDTIRNKLIEILHEAYLLNPQFLSKSSGYKITTQLTFPRLWGLGTSSTLINNIAQWLNIDAFELLQKSFGGSGYDVVCAQCSAPIIYQLVDGKPFVRNTNFNPFFAKKIWFVYLNKKQNSQAAIKSYRNKRENIEQEIKIINSLTKTIATTKNSTEFALALQQHETEMSKILEEQTIQEALFPDFKGTIKSLGAWGGDFVMVLSKKNPTYYFAGKGYATVIPYHEMIL